MARPNLRPGQIYRQTESFPIDWCVVALSEDQEGIPHVRLERVGDRTVTKLLAAWVVQDTRYFSLKQDS